MKSSELNRAITQMIRECPAAAHVIQAELEKRIEVVRCKDCKRCFEKRTKRNNNLMRFCMRLDSNEFQVNANDYCSYGKRKEQ